MIGKVQSCAAVATLLLLGGCGSSDQCTTQPRSNWLSEAEMTQKAVALGYKINVLKVSGSCYEIYGWTKDGKKAEVYFDPVTGTPARTNIEE
jgi:hypothetical protein